MGPLEIATWVGLLLAVVGLWLTFALSKRSRLVIYAQQWTKIVENITASIPGLVVEYRGEGNLQNVVRVTAFVHNVGNVDIDKRDLSVPLTITLPGRSRWLEVGLDSHASNAAVAMAGQTLEISWDLLRKGEKIRFEGLFEYAPDEPKGLAIGKVLKASGRIKNTSLQTLNSINAQPEPIFSIGGTLSSAFLGLFGVLLLLTSSGGVNLNFVEEGVELKTYIGDGEIPCASRDRLPSLWIWDSRPCDIDLTKKPLPEVVVEKSSTDWLGRLLGFLIVVVFLPLQLISSVYDIVTQRRRFGRIVWLPEWVAHLIGRISKKNG